MAAVAPSWGPVVTGRAWAYAGAALGAVVSVSANVAHAFVPPPSAPVGWTPPAGAVAAAVVWPVALLIALEILARVEWPSGGRWLAVRWLGLLPVGAVAAVVSYRHLAGLLTWYGEDAVTATIGPLAVDGLMLLASGALLAAPGSRPDIVPGQDVAEVWAAAPVTVVPDSVAGGVGGDPGALTEARTEPLSDPLTEASTDPLTEASTEAVTPALTDPLTGPLTIADEVSGPVSAPARARRTDTATRVARARARHPEESTAALARRLDLSPATVRRYLAATRLDPVPVPDLASDPAPVLVDA